MKTALLFLLFFVFAVVFRSFKNYNQNPYKAKNPDYDHSFSKKDFYSYEEILSSEFGLIVALMAKVAKADGRISELEAEIIKNTLDEVSTYFDNKQKAREVLKTILDTEKNLSENIEQIASEFYKYTKNAPQKREKILEFLINLAFIDGILSPNEEKLILEIGTAFKIKITQIEEILNHFRNFYATASKKPEFNPYEILGVSKDDSNEIIKKRYRELVKQNHPDIIKGQGFDDNFVEKATKKLQEINGAYEEIKKQRGI